MSESGSREAAATRSLGVVHHHLRSHEDAGRLLAGVLGRARDGSDPALLVIAPTPEDALRLAEVRAARRDQVGAPEEGHLLTPVTSAVRGRRQLAANPAALVGAPSELLQLLAESRLPLGGLKTVVLVWPEELLAAGRAGDVETVLAEVPRTVDRIAIVAQRSQPLDEFLDRVMWRARHIDHLPHETGAELPLRFLAVGAPQRVPALRALLDVLDPECAAIVTLSDTAETAARAAIHALGVEDEDASLRVVRGVPDAPVGLAVLIEVPPPEALDAIAPMATDIVAIVEPAQVAVLRANAGGGAQPFPVGGPLAAAHSELESLRERVRAVVAAQGHLPWLPVIEPMLTDLDPVEVAAGAMALMQRTRRAGRDDRPSESAPAAREERTRRPAGEGAAMTRLFIGIGERDGIRRNDIVGAITGEAGITGAQVGKIVLRDSHAVVEVEGSVAAQVIRKLGGTSLRGRKLVVREDREPAGERPARGGAARPGAARGKSDRPPPARGARGAPKTVRGSSRGEADDRPRRGRERPDIERVPRAAHEGEEWASRGDRLRQSRRSPGGRKER